MKYLFNFFALLALSGSVWGQVPNSFNYQGVARDASGAPLTNQNISLQTGFFHNSVNGTVRYQERHSPTTNDQGVYTLRLGEGAPVVGDWNSIDWKNEKVFLKVDADMGGANNYVPIGISEFASVPYALVAGQVENSMDGDTSAQNELQVLSRVGDTIFISSGNYVVLPSGTVDTDDQQLALNGDSLVIQDGNGVDLSGFRDNTDAQTLGLIGQNLTISNGNSVVLPDQVNDADADPSNELQQLILNGQSLELTGGNTITLPDSVNDADADPMNELQQLQLTGVNLSISGGNTVTLTDQVNDADADPSNELQTLTQNGNIVTLSQNGGAISIQDSDANPFNELQSLSRSGNVISLSNNGGNFNDEVNDADANPTNELQMLNLVNRTLSISQANSVMLPPATVNTDTQRLSLIADTLYIDNGNEVDLSGYRDNTDAQMLSLSGQDLSISGGNTLTLPDAVDDADADPINELQVLSLSNDSIFISNGNFVVLPPGTVDTDDQTLVLSGNILTIDNGNSVDLSAFKDNTDGQTLSLNGNQLSLTNGGSVNLSGVGGGSGFWNQPGTDLYPNSASRVGIGTISPLVKLQVNEASSSPMAAIHGEGYGGNGPTFGQIGLQGKNNHHGVSALDISAVEIGLLGVAVASNTPSGFNSDNYGVWGHADGYGGRFQYDNNGVANNIVYLGGNNFGVHSNGRIGIYTSNPEADLHIKQSTSDNIIPQTGGIILEEGDGDKWTIWAGGDDVNFGRKGTIEFYIDENGGYQTYSDRRLKKNIDPIENVLPRVMQLQAKLYHYTDQDDDQPKVLGFMAQEVQPLFPSAVSMKTEKSMLAMNYDSFGVIAIQAIQEQQDLIETQARQIKALEARLAALESQQD